MRNRGVVKWLHWLALVLILYFMIDEPEISERASEAVRTGELSFHAGMGLILTALTALWFLLYATGGPLGRPGPKLPAWGRTAHRLLNTGLYWALPAMVLSGGLVGLAATFPVQAFGIVPLAPGWGADWLHDAAGELHELLFNALLILIVTHAGFHIWRHSLLKDNALRIMVPKPLHRYL